MNTNTNQLTSLQRHHLAQDMPNKITAMRSEMKYIKALLKQADEAMKIHDWSDVAAIFNELATASTELMVKAEENQQKKGY
jgi:hypothetical protein